MQSILSFTYKRKVDVNMLDIIKSRCYIMSDVFDEEINSLISAGIIDCVQSGISPKVFEKDSEGKYDNQVISCLTAYVKANRGNDRTDTEIYMKMYRSYRDKMTLESDYKGSEKQ